MKKTIITVAACLLPLGGCTAPAVDSNDEFVVEELVSGQQSRAVSQVFEYVTDTDGFTALWHRVGGMVPAVDFERRAVIGVFMGQRSTGGHAIEVLQAVRRGDTLHVTVRLRVPGDGCMTTQAFTTPFQVVTVPAGATQAEFTTERMTVVCR